MVLTIKGKKKSKIVNWTELKCKYLHQFLSDLCGNFFEWKFRMWTLWICKNRFLQDILSFVQFSHILFKPFNVFCIILVSCLQYNSILFKYESQIVFMVVNIKFILMCALHASVVYQNPLLIIRGFVELFCKKNRIGKRDTCATFILNCAYIQDFFTSFLLISGPRILTFVKKSWK